MSYSLSSYDVCTQGLERLRSYNEFMLVTPVSATMTPTEIGEALNDDLQCCMREDHFDYDAARAVIAEFVARLSPANPFNLDEPEDDMEDGEPCYLFLYIRDDDETHIFPVM